MIVVPAIFSPMIDAEVEYARSVSEETVRKLVQNANMLGQLMPLGTIRAIALNQPGVAVPSTTYFQLADGSEITNPLSILRSIGIALRFTPDLKSKYIRGAPNAVSNVVGGSASVNLAHMHGGFTGDLTGSIVGQEGTEKTGRVTHNHPINPDLNASEPLEPSHQVVAFYMKIV